MSEVKVIPGGKRIKQLAVCADSEQSGRPVPLSGTGMVKRVVDFPFQRSEYAVQTVAAVSPRGDLFFFPVVGQSVLLRYVRPSAIQNRQSRAPSTRGRWNCRFNLSDC